jgi:hypothetical protein
MPILIGSVMLYGVTDIATIIDVHPSTVRKYLRDDELTGRKIAGKWYVAAGDLIGWLAKEGYSTTLPAMPVEPVPGDPLTVDFEDDPAPQGWRAELEALKAEAERITARAKALEAAYKQRQT